MSDLKKLLGNRIKKIRKARNLTQEQLAEFVNIGTPNISYIENGKFAPSIDTLQKIAIALNVEPYELYKFDDFKTTEQMKDELFSAFSENEDMLKIFYELFLALRFTLNK